MRIYVSNLPENANETALRRAFEAHGLVDSVAFSRDKLSREWRAVIDMPEEATARKAIDAMNGRDFGGRNLFVSESRPEDAII
jgi:RNA recognition motif-containing protein